MPKKVRTDHVRAELEKGDRLRLAGELVEAARSFRRVLKRDPSNAAAVHSLSLLYQKWNNLPRAIRLVRAAINLSEQPSAVFHTNLGNFLFQSGQVEDAAAEFDRALAIDPGFALPRVNLAVIQRRLGQMQTARQTLAEARERSPSSAEAFFESGVLELAESRFEAATAFLERASELAPARLETWLALAAAYERQEQNLPSARCLFQALRLDPANEVVRTNLGTVLLNLACADQSEHYLLEVLKTNPSADVFGILGTVYKDLGFTDLALDCYAKALDMADSLPEYHNFLYTLLYDPSMNDIEVAEQHRDWARHFAEPLKPATPPTVRDRDADRPLRIGYASGHFRDHAVSLFSRPMILAHDRDRFHITCYSCGSARDFFTEEFRQFAHNWRDIATWDDETAAKQVREDRIDILIDLAGHIGGNRLLLFARKPAPIQMTYLGYQHTTGMDVMDYCITDAIADPPGATDHLYAEKLLRLDPSFFVYAPSDYAPEVAPPPCLEKGYITFGCLNNPTKHTAAAIEVWAELLRALPDSRMLLLGPTAQNADPRVAKLFIAQGIEPNRVFFVGKRTRIAYLHNYAQIDVALDPFPFSGHTTTCDALWQGVPVVTLAGKTYAARMSTSTLTQARFPDWIANSPEQYIDIARHLAQNSAELVMLRQSMRDRLKSAPILDAAGFTRSLERQLRRVWQERCAQING